MEPLVEQFVTFGKKLPGFGMALLVMTALYVHLKGDYTKLSSRETFVAALLCWLLYHAASYLDKLYDKLYGPQAGFQWLWRFRALQDARGRAAVALFHRVDPSVTDYASARVAKRIGDPPLLSLYVLCIAIAKPTDRWHKKIQPMIDISKAARTVFAFSVVMVLVASVVPLRDLLRVGPYIERLGMFSNPWTLSAFALSSVLLYTILRILHNLELYRYVAENVRHLSVGDAFAATIFEVLIESNVLLSREPLTHPTEAA